MSGIMLLACIFFIWYKSGTTGLTWQAILRRMLG
jgi:hypothetical protein